jgi:hypothetical protein
MTKNQFSPDFSLERTTPPHQSAKKKLYFSLIFIHLSILLFNEPSWAGVFFLPHYIPTEQRALGVEPEWLLSRGAGLGVNLRYGQGVSEILNLSGLIGTGSEPQAFRVGGAATLDLYPDDDRQPGLGIAFQGIFSQGSLGSTWSLSAIPYLHKTLTNKGAIPMEPFFALPLGKQVLHPSEPPQFIASFTVGSFFHYGEHWSSVVELGIGITHVMTYFSGGLIYYY